MGEHSEGGGSKDDDIEWRTSGHVWIGEELVRRFRSKLVRGRITRWAPAGEAEDEPALWHNVHDDGEEEDLEHRAEAVYRI